MKRLTQIVVIVVLCSVLISCGASQPKVYHVGLLSGTKTLDGAFDSFKVHLAELGYKEGENIKYSYLLGDTSPEVMQQAAEKFVADKVDLILTTGNGAALAAKKATTANPIPVIALYTVDPDKAGIVASMQQPGGNITAVQTQASIYLAKLPELAKEMVPQAKRYWLPYDPDYVFSPVMLASFESGRVKAGIELVPFQIHSAADVVAELKRLETVDELGFEGIILSYNLIIRQPESEDAIFAFAKKHKIPVIANSDGAVKKGALFLYLASGLAIGELGAGLAEKIFKGENVGDLPVLTAEASLTINYKTAQELGLTIPDYLLEQADEVIRE